MADNFPSFRKEDIFLKSFALYLSFSLSYVKNTDIQLLNKQEQTTNH